MVLVHYTNIQASIEAPMGVGGFAASEVAVTYRSVTNDCHCHNTLRHFATSARR